MTHWTRYERRKEPIIKLDKGLDSSIVARTEAEAVVLEVCHRCPFQSVADRPRCARSFKRSWPALMIRWINTFE